MTIHFRCNTCDHGLAAADRHAGAKVKCPQCGTVVVVPPAGQHPSVGKQPAAADERHPAAEVGQPPSQQQQPWSEEQQGSAVEPGAVETTSGHPIVEAVAAQPAVVEAGAAEPPRGDHHIATNLRSVPVPAAAEVETVDAIDEEEEPVRFAGRRVTDEGLDMTPMVDVTFLLLIFFMVTAAFSLQKSLEIPPPDQSESAKQARTLEEIEQDDDYVIIEIHRDNTVWVNEREAPSPEEVLSILREARQGTAGSDSRGPSSLLVVADGEALHETVVMALDAGNTVGMENIRLTTVEEEDF